MSIVLQIPAGNYEVGSDSIPNAGPRHSRRVARPYWIDGEPVTWAHFEVFVSAGGYARRDLWDSPNGIAGVGFSITVDERCRMLLTTAPGFRESASTTFGMPRQQPITGITWFEARAICRFFNARLAFEVEWEIAMREPHAMSQAVGSRSYEACRNLLGSLQEWTSDPFTPRYWRSEGNQSGTVWCPDSGAPCVSVRGAGPNVLYQHISAWMGAEPSQASPHRGFRRVWDSPPRDDDLQARWRA